MHRKGKGHKRLKLNAMIYHLTAAQAFHAQHAGSARLKFCFRTVFNIAGPSIYVRPGTRYVSISFRNRRYTG